MPYLELVFRSFVLFLKIKTFNHEEERDESKSIFKCVVAVDNPNPCNIINSNKHT